MNHSTSQEHGKDKLYSVLIDKGGNEKNGVIYFADHVYAKDDHEAFEKVKLLEGGRHTQFYSKNTKRYINVYGNT